MKSTHATCGLCGYTGLVENCQGRCPLSKGCSLLRCAACGYEFPDPSRSILARWLLPKTPLSREKNNV